ncbi:MAG: PAS domain S-box protein [Armatimonadetes bacterium]|nr:PAS domain S-box protein [Armatimonadota bacterium]
MLITDMEAHLPSAEGGRDITSLSERELQLLKLAARGKTDQAIANMLGISLATVGTYWGRIRSKIGQFNRTELVAVYLRFQSRLEIDNLRQENRQLINDLSTSRVSANEMAHSVDILRRTLDSCPSPTLIANLEGKILYVNQQTAALFGYSASEMEGRQVEDLMPSRFHKAHVDHRNHFAQRPQKMQMGEHLALLGKHKDGTEFPLAILIEGGAPSDRIAICFLQALPID